MIEIKTLQNNINIIILKIAFSLFILPHFPFCPQVDLHRDFRGKAKTIFPPRASLFCGKRDSKAHGSRKAKASSSPRKTALLQQKKRTFAPKKQDSANRSSPRRGRVSPHSLPRRSRFSLLRAPLHAAFSCRTRAG